MCYFAIKQKTKFLIITLLLRQQAYRTLKRPKISILASGEITRELIEDSHVNHD